MELSKHEGVEQPITQQPGGRNNPKNPIQKQPTVSNIGRNAPPKNEGKINCLAGLKYLGRVDQLLIRQKVELIELISNIENKNTYVIQNSLGQMIFHAVEDTGWFVRRCCGTKRPVQITILDNFKNEILRFNRPFNCTTCLFPCCLQIMEIFYPMSGEHIGSIEQNWNLLFPSFNILNENQEKVLKIRGPLLRCHCCCKDIVLDVLSADGKTIVGAITKQWTGCCEEPLTKTGNFSITFPLNLDVKVKATLLAAAFLMDYVYFESSGNYGANRLSRRYGLYQCMFYCC